MQITLNLPDSLAQTDTFNQSDWLREIAIALPPKYANLQNAIAVSVWISNPIITHEQ